MFCSDFDGFSVEKSMHPCSLHLPMMLLTLVMIVVIVVLVMFLMITNDIFFVNSQNGEHAHLSRSTTLLTETAILTGIVANLEA